MRLTTCQLLRAVSICGLDNCAVLIIDLRTSNNEHPIPIAHHG
jgi:hypothetical protein